jgi:DNA-binding protein H-NS
MKMKNTGLSEKSLDDLWALHEQIVDILCSKMLEEKARLEKRLSELHLRSAVPSIEQARRPYPPVPPKFRNPVQPEETWAGRGKQPRWLLAQLKKGRKLEDFRIAA